MAAYRRVYDSPQLQADCQEPGSAPEPYDRLFYTLVIARAKITHIVHIHIRVYEDHNSMS